MTFNSKYNFLKRKPTVTSFADIIKSAIIANKTTFKTLKKLKELGFMD